MLDGSSIVFLSIRCTSIVATFKRTLAAYYFKIHKDTIVARTKQRSKIKSTSFSPLENTKKSRKYKFSSLSTSFPFFTLTTEVKAIIK